MLWDISASLTECFNFIYSRKSLRRTLILLLLHWCHSDWACLSLSMLLQWGICCSLTFGPDGQELPKCSGKGAIRPGGLPPSVPLFSLTSHVTQIYSDQGLILSPRSWWWLNKFSSPWDLTRKWSWSADFLSSHFCYLCVLLYCKGVCPTNHAESIILESSSPQGMWWDNWMLMLLIAVGEFYLPEQ